MDYSLVECEYFASLLPVFSLMILSVKQAHCGLLNFTVIVLRKMNQHLKLNLSNLGKAQTDGEAKLLLLL